MVHPRDDAMMGRRPGMPLLVLGQAVKAMAPFHKWYRIMATCSTDLCGVDDRICNLIASYAQRVMKKGGVELDDAQEFESTLLGILDVPIARCELGEKVQVKIDLDPDTKTLSGKIVIPCEKHGDVSWEFEIGEGASVDKQGSE